LLVLITKTLVDLLLNLIIDDIIKGNIKSFLRGIIMQFSYDKLWKLLIDNKMKKKDLAAKAKITATTMSNMGKGKAVSLETLGHICEVFNCNIGDIVDVVLDTKEG
jgi:DNA-binding Xre family transcriptional regulator